MSLKKVPKSYPNLYFPLPKKSRFDNKGFNYVRLIVWLKTPKGRRSKYYQSLMVKENSYLKRFKKLSKKKHLELAKKDLLTITKETYSSELKKGYKIGDVYIKYGRFDNKYL